MGLDEMKRLSDRYASPQAYARLTADLDRNFLKTSAARLLTYHGVRVNGPAPEDEVGDFRM